MGEFLSTPIRDKVSEDNENEIVPSFNLVKIRSLWHARLAQKNGRLAHF